MIRTLSDSQLQQYSGEGYITVGRVMDNATLESLRDAESLFRAHPLRNDQDKPGQLTIFRSQVCDFSPAVREYVTRGPHLALMEQLIGPNVALWYTQFVTKLPDINLGKSEFPWHQDNGYMSIEPANNVTIWIALDDVGLENGCVWVMPESHKGGRLDHKQASADSWFMNVPVEGDGIPAILKAGEAVCFTGLTLHRSKLNKTNRARRGFFIEYAQADAVSGDEKRPILEARDSWMVLGSAPIPI